MNFDSRHLQLIAAVIENGSLTKASEKLCITQSAVSHQILEMEGRLKTNLFNRVGKRFIPTAAGKQVYAVAQKILPELHKLHDDLRKINNGIESSLKVSTECYTCYHWLPRLVARFKEDNTDVSCEIITQATRDPIPFLKRGELDIAIVNTVIKDKQLSFDLLFEDEMVAVVSNRNGLSQFQALSLKQLQPEHLHVYHNDISSFALKIFSNAKLSPARISQMALTEAIIEMIDANLGYTIMSTWAAKPFLKGRNISLKRLRGVNCKRKWYAAYTGELVFPKTTFISALRSEVMAACPAYPKS